MARSTNVYLVVEETYEGCAIPHAAFTVKHELAAWLDRHGWNNDWSIWRLPDGGGGEAVSLKCPQDTHNTGKYNGTYSPTTR